MMIDESRVDDKSTSPAAANLRTTTITPPRRRHSAAGWLADANEEDENANLSGPPPLPPPPTTTTTRKRNATANCNGSSRIRLSRELMLRLSSAIHLTSAPTANTTNEKFIGSDQSARRQRRLRQPAPPTTGKTKTTTAKTKRTPSGSTDEDDENNKTTTQTRLANDNSPGRGEPPLFDGRPDAAREQERAELRLRRRENWPTTTTTTTGRCDCCKFTSNKRAKEQLVRSMNCSRGDDDEQPTGRGCGRRRRRAAAHTLGGSPGGPADASGHAPATCCAAPAARAIRVEPGARRQPASSKQTVITSQTNSNLYTTTSRNTFVYEASGAPTTTSSTPPVAHLSSEPNKRPHEETPGGSKRRRRTRAKWRREPASGCGWPWLLPAASLLLVLASLLAPLSAELARPTAGPPLAHDRPTRQTTDQEGGASDLDADPSNALNRAILATMSTQSSLFAATEQLGGNASAREPAATASTPLGEPFGEAPLPPQLPEANLTGAPHEPGEQTPRWLEELLNFGRIFLMGAIIVGDICGNSLVILSVCRHSKLRVTTNWFVVSLACADILVALFAMTFNASVIISGRWLFNRWVCDFWNSCDVLASTASILHLCCISIDRYIAIMRPLDYPMKITTRRVVYALCAVWISSALLSYIPIFTGIYTTSEQIELLRQNPDQCEFVVNRVYAIVSSSISFWIPCCIMVFTYYRIYREATRQEKLIHKAQSLVPAPMVNHHKQNARSKQQRSKSVAVASLSHGGGGGGGGGGQSFKPAPLAGRNQLAPVSELGAGVATTNLSGIAESEPLTGSAVDLNNNNNNSGAAADQFQLKPAGAQQQRMSAAGVNTKQQQQARHKQHDFGAPKPPQAHNDDDDDRDSNSGQSTPTKRSISKMKREHKAAKTLGIIMGVFILCWLPFFSWYTPQHICGSACNGIIPHQVVTLLFWIGYFNSTLNPIIYAYFNHEFRDAFKKTLQWLFCCCQDLKCLRVNRPNDNQHYNCTYRSTQEIGLVSNG